MTEAPLFFSSWDVIGRTVLLGVLSYAGVVLMLRGSGKRTLSKMNMFDFVITIAFGSVLASMLISKNVALAQGVVAFAVLIGLQFVVTYASVRSEGFQAFIKAQPAILYYRGRWFEDRMRKERMSKEELRSSARQAGCGGMDEVGCLILETDGTVSTIKKSAMGDEAALPHRDRAPHTKGR